MPDPASRLANAGAEIEDAEEAVTKARQAYSRGGNVDAVNRADRRLADAHSNYREVSGQGVHRPDR